MAGNFFKFQRSISFGDSSVFASRMISAVDLSSFLHSSSCKLDCLVFFQCWVEMGTVAIPGNSSGDILRDFSSKCQFKFTQNLESIKLQQLKLKCLYLSPPVVTDDQWQTHTNIVSPNLFSKWGISSLKINVSIF